MDRRRFPPTTRKGSREPRPDAVQAPPRRCHPTRPADAPRRAAAGPAERPLGGDLGRPGRRVRVVPNKFPAFSGPDAPAGHGLYRAAPTAGGHEVVIHGTDHHATLADQPAAEVARVMAAWGLRLAAWGDADLGSVSVIVNQSRLAGAS